MSPSFISINVLRVGVVLAGDAEFAEDPDVQRLGCSLPEEAGSVQWSGGGRSVHA